MSSARTTIGAVAGVAMMLGAFATGGYGTPVQVAEVGRNPATTQEPPITLTGGHTADTTPQASQTLRQLALQSGYAVAQDVDYGVVMLQQHPRGWNLSFLLQGTDRQQMKAFIQSWITNLFPDLRSLPPPRQAQDGSITFEFRMQHFRQTATGTY